MQILRRTFPQDDALLDAAAATAHDYDDTHLRTVIHATPPVAGGGFFAGKKEKVKRARSLLHAFILGVETTCRMGNAVTPGPLRARLAHHQYLRRFGAAAAAAKFFGLDEKQIVIGASGIAATQAAGLVEVLGSMARVLNAGFAARNGLAAAGSRREASKARRGRSRACADS